LVRKVSWVTVFLAGNPEMATVFSKWKPKSLPSPSRPYMSTLVVLHPTTFPFFSPSHWPIKTQQLCSCPRAFALNHPSAWSSPYLNIYTTILYFFQVLYSMSPKSGFP
jgi:hypothetical protein